MAYQMIHMEVAYRLLDRLPWITQKADFILGSVAPDSVHMNPEYQVSMKEISHLFTGSGEWGNTEDYGNWDRNIRTFWQDHGQQESLSRNFAAGICVHCWTDLIYARDIWMKLRHHYTPIMGFDTFQKAYSVEARGIDLWLWQNSSNTSEIRKMLAEGKIHELSGLLHQQDMEKLKHNLLYRQYQAEPVAVSDYQYVPEAVINDFLTVASNEIAAYFDQINADIRGEKI